MSDAKPRVLVTRRMPPNVTSRLERDFALNTPGVALALDLLDEIDDLRSRLRSLENQR